MSAPPSKIHMSDSEGEEEKQNSGSEEVDTDEESPEDYRPGGYHPVKVGEIFLNRYVILQKLG